MRWRQERGWVEASSKQILPYCMIFSPAPVMLCFEPGVSPAVITTKRARWWYIWIADYTKRLLSCLIPALRLCFPWHWFLLQFFWFKMREGRIWARTVHFNWDTGPSKQWSSTFVAAPKTAGWIIKYLHISFSLQNLDQAKIGFIVFSSAAYQFFICAKLWIQAFC